MHSLAMTYGFIVPSSAPVEIVSSYFVSFLTHFRVVPELHHLLTIGIAKLQGSVGKDSNHDFLTRSPHDFITTCMEIFNGDA